MQEAALQWEAALQQVVISTLPGVLQISDFMYSVPQKVIESCGKRFLSSKWPCPAYPCCCLCSDRRTRKGIRQVHCWTYLAGLIGFQRTKKLLKYQKYSIIALSCIWIFNFKSYCIFFACRECGVRRKGCLPNQHIHKYVVLMEILISFFLGFWRVRTLSLSCRRSGSKFKHTHSVWASAQGKNATIAL